MSRSVSVLLALALLGASACAKSEPASGCSVAESEEGVVLTCPDGSSVTIELGENGVDGEDGDDGSDGDDGTNGQGGVDGLDGTDGIDGTDGTDGQDGTSVLVRVDTVDPGETCEAGGYTVSFGHDDDGDGALADGEIEATAVVCNGPGGGTGVDTAEDTAGDTGGDDTSTADTGGVDTATVDTGEDTSTGGDTGTDTSASVDTGEDSDTGSADTGEDTSAGGDTGTDTGASVETGEDTSTGGVETGTDAGAASLVRVDAIEPGEVCHDGGNALRFGADDNADGALSDDEIESTVVSCIELGDTGDTAEDTGALAETGAPG